MKIKIILITSMIFSLNLFWCTNTNQEKSYSQKLFEAKTSYVWDISRVSNLLGELNLNSFWTYKIALQTESEPYWLMIIYDKNITNNIIEFEKSILSNTVLVISLIENLSQVEWNYHDWIQNINKNFYLEEINNLIWNNVKDYSESPEKLQELIEKLENL